MQKPENSTSIIVRFNANWFPLFCCGFYPADFTIALLKALPLLFPSPTPPPKRLGGASEALIHVLEVRIMLCSVHFVFPLLSSTSWHVLHLVIYRKMRIPTSISRNAHCPPQSCCTTAEPAFLQLATLLWVPWRKSPMVWLHWWHTTTPFT